MATKLRKIKILNPLFMIRDNLMDKLGLFHLKHYLKQRLFFKQLIREDNLLKKKILNKVFLLPSNLITNEITQDDVVVSLTSYGDRIVDALPYALFSLVTQTLLPKKIVVYIDETKWSDENIPAILKEYQRIGVTFCYCEDLRSHTKLLHALKQYPHNPIITVDDDLYYNNHCIEWLYSAYQNSDKLTVLGMWGCIPEKKNGKFLPYSKWKDCKYRNEDSEISFFGVGSCCYPPHIFDDEIFKKEIFLQLCPTADDIWFWAMQERLHIKKEYITPCGFGFHRSVNRIEEYDWGQQGTLMYQNVVQGKNDQQLRNVVEYYQLEN